MNKPSPVNVTILDKDYLIACTETEKEMLQHSVDYLNQKMKELKRSGVIGAERIAIMSALNIINEFLNYKKENQAYTANISKTINQLQRKMHEVLSNQ